MEDILRAIRRDCRLAMNGVISTSMREYGLDYKLNFGLVAQQIKGLADKYGSSAPLAERLWNESTRELKILATLVYPVDEFSVEIADEWVASIPNQEIREQLCINLLQNTPIACQLADKWVQSNDCGIRTSGYWLMTRLLLMKRYTETPSVDNLNSYIWTDAISNDIFTRNASLHVLKHIVRVSKVQADKILEQLLPYKDNENPVKKEAYNTIAFEIEFMYS